MADQRGAVNVLEETATIFEKNCFLPELYADPDDKLKVKLLEILKDVYDSSKRLESNYETKCNCPINELLTVGFDLEQIWQQIQLQNEPALRRLKKTTKKIENIKSVVVNDGSSVSRSPAPMAKVENESKSIPSGADRLMENSDIDEDDHEISDNDIDHEDFSDDEDLEENNKPINKGGRRSIVDDQFFNLSEMEQFLDQEDRKEQRKMDGDEDKDSSDEEEIDYFGVIESENEDEGSEGEVDPRYVKYGDFFDPPTKESVKNKTNIDTSKRNQEDENTELAGNDEGESEDDVATETHLSKHEREQLEIEKKIKRLEKANVSKKPWQLLGESSATQRPLNSLLEEHVTFDHTSVGAPAITEETTEVLEDLIRQRIKDEAWDDVMRKVKPNLEEEGKFKKPIVLDQTKSKLGLAEVYEREYIKQTEKENDEEENKDHIAIKHMMSRLFVKLDALSNFHFTPKPPKRELSVVTNVPSLQVEEIAPDSVTDAMRLAPEEVHATKKTVEKGDSEKTTTDKKRERRVKKATRRKQESEKTKKRKLSEKENGRAGKPSKKRALDTLSKSTKNTIITPVDTVDNSLKSSSAFFTKLQDEVKNKISKTKHDGNVKRKGKFSTRAEAVKL